MNKDNLIGLKITLDSVYDLLNEGICNLWGWDIMTTNKKDQTEDILEKVKDVLEKNDEK